LPVFRSTWCSGATIVYLVFKPKRGQVHLRA
jgi:hypothetical protein